MLAWMTHKLESRYADDMQICRRYHANSWKWRGTSPDEEFHLMRVKQESEKAGLKLNIQKTKIIASSPITSWQTEEKKAETVADFILGGSKITADSDCSHEVGRRLLSGREAMTHLDCICAVLCSFAQLCLTLWDPMDCSPPGSSVHGDSPGKNTRVVAMPSSRGSSKPRDRTPVSCVESRFFTIWATSEVHLDSILKSKAITLPTKVHIVKAMFFPVVMYRCESWTIKKAENQRTDTLKLWCCRRLLRVPWTARRSNQLILKEINPEYSLEGLIQYSLEGLILKLNFQYLSHLIQRAASLEKTLMLGQTEGKKRRGSREWDD